MRHTKDLGGPVVRESVLFFDSLPPELLHVIVRYISECPGSDTWLVSLDHVDIFTVLQARGTLGETVRELFTHMRVGLSAFLLHSVEVVSKLFMQFKAPLLRSLSIDN